MGSSTKDLVRGNLVGEWVYEHPDDPFPSGGTGRHSMLASNLNPEFYGRAAPSRPDQLRVFGLTGGGTGAQLTKLFGASTLPGASRFTGLFKLIAHPCHRVHHGHLKQMLCMNVPASGGWVEAYLARYPEVRDDIGHHVTWPPPIGPASAWWRTELLARFSDFGWVDKVRAALPEGADASCEAIDLLRPGILIGRTDWSTLAVIPHTGDGRDALERHARAAGRVADELGIDVLLLTGLEFSDHWSVAGGRDDYRTQRVTLRPSSDDLAACETAARSVAGAVPAPLRGRVGIASYGALWPDVVEGGWRPVDALERLRAVAVGSRVSAATVFSPLTDIGSHR